jgi:serine/threonine protein kinase
MTAPAPVDPWVEIIRRCGIICGRYEGPEPLGDGRGGNFSITFAATDRLTGEKVVLKFLHPSYQGHYRGEAFKREMEVARALVGRDNVVQLRSGPETLMAEAVVNGIATPFGLSFYVLERASETLAAYLLGRKSPSLRRRLEAVRDLAKGVNRLHLAGYCHRDIKPDNALMCPGGVVKVSDYGTCRLLDVDEPPLRGEYDAPQGALQYTAPEVLMGGWNRRNLYRGADWFAVGAVLFESITGINLYVHIGLQSDIGRWLQTFQGIPERDRLAVFEHHVEDIAGRYPIPSVREFSSGNPHLMGASPAALAAIDRVLHGLCHFDHRRRLTRFENVLRAVDIALGYARLDERHHSLMMMRGLVPITPIPVRRIGRS